MTILSNTSGWATSQGRSLDSTCRGVHYIHAVQVLVLLRCGLLYKKVHVSIFYAIFNLLHRFHVAFLDVSDINLWIQCRHPTRGLFMGMPWRLRGDRLHVRVVSVDQRILLQEIDEYRE